LKPWCLGSAGRGRPRMARGLLADEEIPQRQNAEITSVEHVQGIFG
jgi:hypothetical protein